MTEAAIRASGIWLTLVKITAAITFASHDAAQAAVRVGAVSPAEWGNIQSELRESTNRIKALIRETREWPEETQIGVAIAAIVHTAYHPARFDKLCVL